MSVLTHDENSKKEGDVALCQLSLLIYSLRCSNVRDGVPNLKERDLTLNPHFIIKFTGDLDAPIAFQPKLHHRCYEGREAKKNTCLFS